MLAFFSSAKRTKKSSNGPINVKTICKNTLLAKPENEKKLLLYIAVFKVAVSLILVKEAGQQQLLIYYVSKALQGVEARYSDMESWPLP